MAGAIFFDVFESFLFALPFPEALKAWQAQLGNVLGTLAICLRQMTTHLGNIVC